MKRVKVDMSNYLINKWTEDIEVYARHANLCRQTKAHIIEDFTRAGRKVPMSQQGRLYDLDFAIKEYEEDIEKLKARIEEENKNG